jgi:hypothetical protein
MTPPAGWRDDQARELHVVDREPTDTLIIIRREATRPLIVGPADSYDEALAMDWIASQPNLLDLLQHALALCGFESQVEPGPADG